MTDTDNVASSNYPWWQPLVAEEASKVGMEGISADAWLKSFPRRCYRSYFSETPKLSRSSYYHSCFVVWMAQCIGSGQAVTGKDIWRAVQESLKVDSDVMASWILPSIPQGSLDDGFEQQIQDDENINLHYMSHLATFWQTFLDACENSAPLSGPRSKRRRTNYQPHWMQPSLSDRSCELPTMYVLATVILKLGSSLNPPPRWEAIKRQVLETHGVFKMFNESGVKGGLALLGLQCLKQGDIIRGLTPPVLLETCFGCTGDSTFSTLKDATELDDYHLRAAICEHLLQPLFADDSDYIDDEDPPLTEEDSQKTIRDCRDFINSQQPSKYLKQIVAPEETETGRPSGNSSRAPDRVTSQGYPLLQHIGVWLLNDDIWLVADLVREMDAHTHLDGLVKDEACMHVWQYLLRSGKLFLDGNHIETAAYKKKRELLYSGVVSGMGIYGKGSMVDFFEEVANTVWHHPDASESEKRYVLMACQHTLLRLFYKCYRPGNATVQAFIQNTSWPVPLSLTGTVSTNLENWAAAFLLTSNPIPESLLVPAGGNGGDLVVNLDRLTEGQLPKETDEVEGGQAMIQQPEPTATPLREYQPEPTTVVELPDDDMVVGPAPEESDEEVPQMSLPGDRDDDVFLTVQDGAEEQEQVSSVDEEEAEVERRQWLDGEEVSGSLDVDSEIEERKIADLDVGDAEDDRSDVGNEFEQMVGNDESDAEVVQVDEDVDEGESEVSDTHKDASGDDQDSREDEQHSDDEAVEQLESPEFAAAQGMAAMEPSSSRSIEEDVDAADESVKTDSGGGDTTEEEETLPFRKSEDMDVEDDTEDDREGSVQSGGVLEGYEPESTHGYTEEDISEALPTEDEEDEQATPLKGDALEVEKPVETVRVAKGGASRSSDDMDAADERTEQEEDQGVEYSEVEETVTGRQQQASPRLEDKFDPTTLLEFALSAQRQHDSIRETTDHAETETKEVVDDEEKMDSPADEAADGEKMDAPADEGDDDEKMDAPADEVDAEEKMGAPAEFDAAEKMGAPADVVDDEEQMDARSEEVNDEEQMDAPADEVDDEEKMDVPADEVDDEEKMDVPADEDVVEVIDIVDETEETKVSLEVEAHMPSDDNVEGKTDKTDEPLSAIEMPDSVQQPVTQPEDLEDGLDAEGGDDGGGDNAPKEDITVNINDNIVREKNIDLVPESDQEIEPEVDADSHDEDIPATADLEDNAEVEVQTTAKSEIDESAEAEGRDMLSESRGDDVNAEETIETVETQDKSAKADLESPTEAGGGLEMEVEESMEDDVDADKETAEAQDMEVEEEMTERNAVSMEIQTETLGSGDGEMNTGEGQAGEEEDKSMSDRSEEMAEPDNTSSVKEDDAGDSEMVPAEPREDSDIQLPDNVNGEDNIPLEPAPTQPKEDEGMVSVSSPTNEGAEEASSADETVEVVEDSPPGIVPRKNVHSPLARETESPTSKVETGLESSQNVTSASGIPTPKETEEMSTSETKRMAKEESEEKTDRTPVKEASQDQLGSVKSERKRVLEEVSPVKVAADSIFTEVYEVQLEQPNIQMENPRQLPSVGEQPKEESEVDQERDAEPLSARSSRRTRRPKEAEPRAVPSKDTRETIDRYKESDSEAGSAAGTRLRRSTRSRKRRGTDENVESEDDNESVASGSQGGRSRRNPPNIAARQTRKKREVQMSDGAESEKEEASVSSSKARRSTRSRSRRQDKPSEDEYLPGDGTEETDDHSVASVVDSVVEEDDATDQIDAPTESQGYSLRRSKRSRKSKRPDESPEAKGKTEDVDSQSMGSAPERKPRTRKATKTSKDEGPKTKRLAQPPADGDNEGDDDASVPSVASRTRSTRSRSRAGDDDSHASVGSVPSRIQTRRGKTQGQDDDESVASNASRMSTRSKGKATENADKPKRKASTRTAKLPPRAPRRSTRSAKKKA